MNSLEIIFSSCEFLSLYPATYHRLSPMGMSSVSELSFSFAGGWKAIGLPMHGLPKSGWLGAIGQVVMAVWFVKVLPSDAQSGIIWQTWRDCCTFFHKINIHSFSLGCEVSCLTCKLLNSSAYAYPTELKIMRSRPTWDFPRLSVTIDFRLVLHSGLVLKN